MAFWAILAIQHQLSITPNASLKTFIQQEEQFFVFKLQCRFRSCFAQKSTGETFSTPLRGVFVATP